jgi:competence protein ComEC
MVEQSRSRGRAEAWRPWIAAGRRPALAWPQGLTDFARRAAQRLREWTAAEVAPGRLVPWLAIAFGCGTIIYFAVEREPAPWAAAALLAATVAAVILCRHRPFAFPATLGIAAMAAGFATATVKREIIAHPVLDGAGMERRAGGLRRAARRARALRAHRRAPRAH